MSSYYRGIINNIFGLKNKLERNDFIEAFYKSDCNYIFDATKIREKLDKFKANNAKLILKYENESY